MWGFLKLIIAVNVVDNVDSDNKDSDNQLVRRDTDTHGIKDD